MHRVLGSMSEIYIRDGQDEGESVENWEQLWWILKACNEEALAEALENGDLDGEDPAPLPGAKRSAKPRKVRGVNTVEIHQVIKNMRQFAKRLLNKERKLYKFEAQFLAGGEAAPPESFVKTQRFLVARGKARLLAGHIRAYTLLRHQSIHTLINFRHVGNYFPVVLAEFIIYVKTT